MTNRSVSGTSKTMSKQAAGPHTRSNTHTPETSLPEKITEKAKQDLVRNSQSKVKCRDSARRWLADNNLIIEGETTTIATLSMALLWIADGRLNAIIDWISGMRAVALCMDSLHLNDSINDITTDAKKAIDRISELAAEQINKAAEASRITMEKEETERKARREEDEEKQKAERKAEDERLTKQAAAAAATAAVEAQRNQKTHNGAATSTYADATRSSKPATSQNRDTKLREEITVREKKKAKQILIDGLPGIKKAEDVKPEEMVKKMNTAWNSLDTDYTDHVDGRSILKPTGAKFVTAKGLNNGGVLMEMNTEEGIDYLKVPEARRNFEENLGEEVSIKERAHTVLTEFVPTGLRQSLEKMERKIEDDNGLELGDLTRIRWMRDPETNWRQGQKYAHAILTIRRRSQANKILRDGIIISGQRHRTRKLEDDPRRCYKCQVIEPGHRAAECKNAEVCADCCSKNHTTAKCDRSRQQQKCASCTEAQLPHQHASWSRECPIYIKHRNKLRDRLPENHLRYYPDPTEDWTWTRKEDSTDDDMYAERWNGEYDRRRTQEIAQRQAPEQHQDNGYAKRDGPGRARGDFYRPTDTYIPAPRERSRDPRTPNASQQASTQASSKTTATQQPTEERRRSVSRAPRGRSTTRGRRNNASQQQTTSRQRTLKETWSEQVESETDSTSNHASRK